MRNSAPLNKSGFTLIEILVATVILAFSSLMVYNVILGSFELNRKLTSESDSLLTIGTAMYSLERDISQIFSPQLGPTTPPANNSPEEFWSAPQREDGLRRTRFVGTREKITFIASSNRRIQAEARETDLAKITYQIVQEKDGTYSLTKAVDNDVFDYEDREIGDEGAINEVKILEKLVQANFSYYRADKQRWEEKWDSEAPYTEDASRFPDTVSIDLQYTSTDNVKAILKWRSEFAPVRKLNAKPASAPNTTNNPNTTPPASGDNNQ
jgi:type II secretion system protein J